MSTASRHFRSRFWFNSILIRAINMAMNNVWCIRKHFGVNDSVASVRETIAMQFLEEFEEKCNLNCGHNKQPYIPLYLRDMQELHKIRLNRLPEHWPDTRKTNSVRCVLCKKGRTNIYCVRCNVHLHPGNCYSSWHTVVDV